VTIDFVFIHPTYNNESEQEVRRFNEEATKLYNFSASRQAPYIFEDINVALSKVEELKQQKAELVKKRDADEAEIKNLNASISALKIGVACCEEKKLCYDDKERLERQVAEAAAERNKALLNLAIPSALCGFIVALLLVKISDCCQGGGYEGSWKQATRKTMYV